MKRRHLMFCIAVIAVFALVSQAKDPPKEFKDKLFDRYDQKQVITLPADIILGLETGKYVKTHNSLYIHYHEGTEMKKTKRAEPLDDRTFAVDTPDSESMRRIPSSERLRVHKFYVEDDYLAFLLRPVRAPTTGRSDATEGKERPYGVVFRFKFPKPVFEAGDYDTAVREVNKYLLPADEYREVAEAAKTIEIQPGTSKDEVIKAMGEPLKSVVFGKKTILKYADVTVELEDDKVTELKAN